MKLLAIADTKVTLLALLLVIGCGDNLPDPALPRSGTRLKLAWYVYEDGTRQRETSWYYDAELGQRCTPSMWSDGNRYCTPPNDEALYVSDTCTRALGRTPMGSTPAPFFTTSFMLSGERQTSRVFRRGAPTAPVFSFWEKHTNGCFGPFQAGDGFDYFELGSEVTDLVQLHHAQRGDGTLAIVDELSDDGLRVPTGFFDRTLSVECAPAERGNAQSVECVPTDSALISYFHEVGCIEPELAITGTAVPTTAKQYSTRTRCWSYYDVGAEVSAPPLYEAIGLTCTSVAPPNGARFFVMAGPREQRTIPGLLRERETTERRLAHIDLVGDGVRLADPLLFDRDLAAECRRNDELRCVPVTEAQTESFFADSGCTMPIDLALVPTGDCDPPSQFARKGNVTYRLGQRYTRQIYWLSTGDTCGTYAPPTPFVAWALGEMIDPSRFASAEVTIDP
jgi:hypothetical protein